MKVSENDRALTKRDLLNKLGKVMKALGTQSQRADDAERECDRLRAAVIRLSATNREGTSIQNS